MKSVAVDDVLSNIKLMELRKKRLQERLKNITDPGQRQAVSNAVVRLDCYVQSLRKRFQS